MSILLNRWEIDYSYDYGSYDYRMRWLFNICELDDSSDGESYKYNNLKNNEDWIDKGLDYTEYFSEEYNYDENSITDDEMADLIGRYESDDSSSKGEYNVTVIFCEKIENSEEEKYTYVMRVKSLSESKKYFERVETVNNPKGESDYQVGKLKNVLEIMEKVFIF